MIRKQYRRAITVTAAALERIQEAARARGMDGSGLVELALRQPLTPEQERDLVARTRAASSPMQLAGVRRYQRERAARRGGQP
jgi:hypothetical protein